MNTEMHEMFTAPLREIEVPNAGPLVVDYFSESHNGSNWELQVRNNSGQPVSWQAVFPLRDYKEIDLPIGQYMYRMIDHDGLQFTHIFAGIGRFEPWEGIQIQANRLSADTRPAVSVAPIIHAF